MIWRVAALLRRSQMVSQRKTKLGSTEFNANTLTVCFNGKELVLGENDELPELTGVTMEGSVEVAPGSCVFFVM